MAHLVARGLDGERREVQGQEVWGMPVAGHMGGDTSVTMLVPQIGDPREHLLQMTSAL